MPKKGHTEEQIAAVLRQAEAGEKVSELCRKVGISEATYYAWKKRYAGLGVSELRELRQLRDENGPVKNKARAAAETGPLGSANDQIGQRRAARLMKVGWSTWLYRRKVRQLEEVLRRRLCEMAATYVRYGYRRLTVMLRREGWEVNAKRIYRLYAEERMCVEHGHCTG